MIKVNYYHHKILILLIPRKKQYNDKNRNDPNYVIKSTTDLIPFWTLFSQDTLIELLAWFNSESLLATCSHALFSLGISHSFIFVKCFLVA